MNQRVAPKKTPAFTLLELMLAITIFSGLIIAMYATWTAILRSSQSGLTAAIEAHKIRTAIRAIDESFKSATIYEANLALYSFICDTQSDQNFAFYSLVSRLSEGFPGSGLFHDQPIRRLFFAVETTNEVRQLVMRQNPILGPLEEGQEAYPLVLLENVERFQLQFWDDNLHDWAPEWIYTNQFPRMIHYSILTCPPIRNSDGNRQTPREINRIVHVPASTIETRWQTPPPCPEISNRTPTNEPVMRLRQPERNRLRGIALIMAMLMILLFGILAANFAFSMKVEMQLAANTTQDPDMEWLGRSGLELARFILSESSQVLSSVSIDALNQKWAGGPLGTNEVLAMIPMKNVALGKGRFDIDIQDLDRKFNINIVDAPFFSYVLEALGVDPFAKDVIIDSTTDWMDKDEFLTPNGAEGDFYLNEPNPPFAPYFTKNGPIDYISELLLIKGITPQLYYGSGSAEPAESINQNWNPNATGLRDIFTTIGGPKVNINTASPTVLRLIPGLHPSQVNELLLHRRGLDGIDGTLDDQPFMRIQDCFSLIGLNPEDQATFQLDRLLTTRSRYFEVTITTRFGDYTKIYRAWVVRFGTYRIQVINFHPV